MIKVVAFDYDGVLIRSSDVHLRTWEEILDKEGIDHRVTGEMIESHFGESYEDMIKHLLPEEHKDKSKIVLERLLGIFRSPEYPKKFEKVEGVREFLEGLKERGFKLAVASGNKRDILHNWLKVAGVIELFDMIISAEDIERGKPHPDMLEKVMSFFKVGKEEIIFVGDAKDDIRMGKAAGVKTVAVLTGAMDRAEAEREGADIILEKVTDLKV
ncbi:MAG: HAD family hydrolase [Candidatus Aenigmatarchaeota archaeon]